jgi:hypothetical protein
MTANSVLSGGALHLTQGYIYRARMLIKAPGALATESKVSDALAEQGFADITFLDKSSLPADWPSDQRDDPSGMFSWTAYLQGRFTLTDRAINLSELPGTVEVEDMWVFMVPQSAAPPVPPPQPGGPPAQVEPSASVSDVYVPPPLTGGQRVMAALIGAAAGWWIVRVLSKGGS